MPLENSWETIQLELSQLIRHEEYKLLRPLLDGLQSMVAAKYPTPEIVSGLLEVVKRIQMEIRRGGNPHELARQLASGYIQPQWNVQGSVNQANRDLFNQFIIQFFSTNLSELEHKKSNSSIFLPIVLVVMNASEAQELASGSVLHNYPVEVRTELKKLQALLAEQHTVDWVQRYRNESQEWQPFKNSTETIKQLLDRAIAFVKGYKHPIQPDFVDIRTLNNYRDKLKQLRFHGCVVIMDVISMRHPVIQREFRRSLLDAFPNTMVATVAPISDALQIKQQMISIIEQHIDLECHKRLHLDCDQLCDEISDFSRFGRWFQHVEKLLPADAKLQEDGRQYWYQLKGGG